MPDSSRSRKVTALKRKGTAKKTQRSRTDTRIMHLEVAEDAAGVEDGGSGVEEEGAAEVAEGGSAAEAEEQNPPNLTQTNLKISLKMHFSHGKNKFTSMVVIYYY